MKFANYRVARDAGYSYAFYTVFTGWLYYPSPEDAWSAMDEAGFRTVVHDSQGRRVARPEVLA